MSYFPQCVSLYRDLVHFETNIAQRNPAQTENDTDRLIVVEMNTCGSCVGRLACLGRGIVGLIMIVAMPIIIGYDAYQGRLGHQWANSGCKVLDIGLAVLLSPVVMTLYTIRNLFGAIFHPGIVYTANPNEPKDPFG